MSAARSLGNFGNQNTLVVDATTTEVGINTGTPNSDLDIGGNILMDGPAGVVTATSFKGDGSALTGINASGLTGTPSITVQDIIAVGATFSGVLTYEDVTNVDAIGVITARSGVAYGTGIGATIHSPSANNLALGTNSVEKIRILANGKVGINTTAPAQQLTSYATSGYPVMANGPSNGIGLGGNGGIVFGTFDLGSYARGMLDASELQVKISGDERLMVQSTGDIDIYGTAVGVTSATWDASANSFIFKDDSYAKFGDGSDLSLYHTAGASWINNTTGDLILRNSASPGDVYIQAGGAKLGLKVVKDAEAELYFNNNEKLATTNAGVSITGVTTSTAGIHAGPGILRENMRGYGSAMNGAYTADILSTGMVLNAPTNSTATFSINVRGDGSTTFNSLMNSGESTVFTAFVGQNNSSYYLTDFQIDGSSIAEEWAGGSAPSSGGSSGTDVYTFTILKTANATFSVFANQTNFA